MQCVFCESKDIKLRTILASDDGLAWAFLTNIPITPGHTLIAPTRHVSVLSELTDGELRAMRELEVRVTGALKRVFGAEGFNFAWNEGPVAGQSVPHFHLHVVPRKKGDTGVTEYEPRKFLYRPGSRADTPEDELQEVTSLIKSHLR